MPSPVDFKNWRFNPFTGNFHPNDIVDEIRVVELQEEWNAFGIELNEAPQLFDTQTLENNVVIFENVTGGAQFTQVPRTSAPNSGQFRVDYDADTYHGTGRIEFNPADDLTEVRVTYKGLGTVVKDRYQLLQTTVIPTNVTVEGNLTVTDQVIIDELVPIDIDHATRKDYVDDLINQIGFGNLQTFTTDGTFDVTDIELVYFITKGAGASGVGVDNPSVVRGYPGGRSGEHREGFFDVSAMTSLAIVVGVGGVGNAGVGNAGTDSSIIENATGGVTLVLAKGGTVGTLILTGVVPTGGSGGVNLGSQPGENQRTAASVDGVGGNGGGSSGGRGGRQSGSGDTPEVGGIGSGGGGVVVVASGSDSGADGGDGIVLIYFSEA